MVGLIVGFLVVSAGAGHAASITLRDDTGVSALSVGDSFSLSLIFDDQGGPGLLGFGTHVSFDSTVIAFDGVVFDPRLSIQSPGLADQGGFQIFNLTATSPGPIVAGGALVTGSDETLATLNFTAIGVGSTSVAFSNAAPMGFATLLVPIATVSFVDPASPLSAAVDVVPLPAGVLLLMTGLGALAAIDRAPRNRARRSVPNPAQTSVRG